MKFETISKPVAKATKTKTIIYADGVEIGSRTSAHTYKFALVVTGNQEHAIRQARAYVDYNTAKAEQYEGIVRRDEAAIQSHIKNDRVPRHNIEKCLEDGSYIRWGISYRSRALEWKDRLEVLLSGPQPEFSLPLVASWHSRRDLVPDAKPWQKFVAVVEIT